ncbi:hypothetical protein HELRODRAFT_175112 [Helobdella robusta]|uniref:Uncharacterized protein n=1 Tax=Helobdella robusta TaxID=6412 RepID=T1F8V5_HELRO|nr:hypothetical protein HELRODRAFT_175112 [Helobdella robusta]ESO01085.1 hypothetical protein HELRODRAFT_175112 [Helobdella robusta]
MPSAQKPKREKSDGNEDDCTEQSSLNESSSGFSPSQSFKLRIKIGNKTIGTKSCPLTFGKNEQEEENILDDGDNYNDAMCEPQFIEEEVVDDEIVVDNDVNHNDNSYGEVVLDDIQYMDDMYDNYTGNYEEVLDDDYDDDADDDINNVNNSNKYESSDEERKWLDALELGQLDDNGEVKRSDKNMKVLTARQKTATHPNILSKTDKGNNPKNLYSHSYHPYLLIKMFV